MIPIALTPVGSAILPLSPFGIIGERINMLHPSVISTGGGDHVPPEVPYGVSVTLPASYVWQWTRGGSNTLGNNAVTLGPSVRAPNGSMTGRKIVESGLNQGHFLTAGYIATTSNPATQSANWSVTKYRLSVVAKAAERTRIVLEMTDTIWSRYFPGATPAHSGPSGVKATFDLAGGQIAVANAAFGVGWEAGSASISALSGGWYLCTIDCIGGIFFNYAAPNTTLLVNCYLDAGTGLAAENSSYAGNATSGVYVWRSICLPAGAFGLNTRVFFDDFDSDATIDNDDTRVEGFNWYPVNNWPGFGSLLGSPVVLRPGIDYDVAESVLTMHATSPNIVPNNYMHSAVWHGVIGASGGNSFALPALFETKAGWDFIGPFMGPSYAWPAFWASTVESMSTTSPVTGGFPGAINSLEFDFVEANPNNEPAAESGISNSSIFRWLVTNPITTRQVQAACVPFNVTTYDFSQMHVYSQLALPQPAGAPSIPAGQHNILPNTSFAGGVPGTPGTIPTRMAFANVPVGLTTQIVSISAGKIQLRFTSAAPVSGAFYLRLNIGPVSSANSTVAPGQIWTQSIKMRMVAGTYQISSGMSLIECDAAGIPISVNRTFPGFTISEISTDLTRFSHPYLLGASIVERIEFRVNFTLFAADPIDMTFEISEPQLERGVMPTPFQASTGADTQGVAGVAFSAIEPYFGRHYLFLDGNACNEMIFSSLTELGMQADPLAFLPGYTPHMDVILSCSPDSWPSYYDYVAVYGV